MPEMSDAQRGLDIMRKSGEAAARQFLLDHEHPRSGGDSAHETGTLILEDGSSVAITEEHYAFRWTLNEHEFSMSHPASEATTPWPARRTSTSLSHMVAARVLTEVENEERERVGTGKDAPRLQMSDALAAAPGMWDAINEAMMAEGDRSAAVVEARTAFIRACAIEVKERRLPDRQQDRLRRAAARAIEGAENEP